MTIIVSRLDNAQDENGAPGRAVGFTVTENGRSFYIDTCITLTDSVNTDQLAVDAAIAQLSAQIQTQVAALDQLPPLLGQQVSLPS